MIRLREHNTKSDIGWNIRFNIGYDIGYTYCKLVINVEHNGHWNLAFANLHLCRLKRD